MSHDYLIITFPILLQNCSQQRIITCCMGDSKYVKSIKAVVAQQSWAPGGTSAMDIGWQSSVSECSLVSPTPQSAPSPEVWESQTMMKSKKQWEKHIFFIVFHQDRGDRCRGPRAGASQASSMGLSWSSKKKGKPGCSCHSDTGGWGLSTVTVPIHT